MKLLIIEDDKEKLEAVTSFIDKLSLDIVIFPAPNYKEGKKKLREKFDFLILDMTLPLKNDAQEGKLATAGIDLLEVMKHRNIETPCVVLTQYDTFGKHKDKVSLDDLINKIDLEYSDIVDDVLFYDSSDGQWEEGLENVLRKYSC
jgi:DNA-binding response OmpR family regulator